MPYKSGCKTACVMNQHIACIGKAEYSYRDLNKYLRDGNPIVLYDVDKQQIVREIDGFYFDND